MDSLRALIRENIALVLEGKDKFMELLRDAISKDGELNKYGDIRKIKGWPTIPNREGDSEEILDLENNEFISLDNNKLVLNTGGDWQDPYVVEIGLKGGQLQVINYRPSDKGERKKKSMKEKEILDKLYENHLFHKDKNELLLLIKKHLSKFSPWDNSYGKENYENEIVEGPKISEDKNGVFVTWKLGGNDKYADKPSNLKSGEIHSKFIAREFNEWTKEKVWFSDRIKTGTENLGDDKVKFYIELKK